jgi:hypothetical protein
VQSTEAPKRNRRSVKIKEKRNIMAKNPADMTNKELEDAIANPPADGLIPPVEVVIPPEEPESKGKKKPDDKEPSKEEPKPDPLEPEEEDPVVEPEVEEPSRREKLRIVDLLGKLKEKDTAPASAPTATGLDYTKDLDADPAVIKKLQEDRQAAATAAYQQGVEQANSIRFHTRLDIDAPRVESKYPQLDKNDEKKFRPTIANAVNTMYLAAAGYDPGDPTKGVAESVKNPNLRYVDYIEGIFELADEIASDRNEVSTKNIAKQVAKTGLRPDGSRTKTLNLNKLPEQMTDEELDARIALAIPQLPR